jgi:hypothetical protein
MLAWSRGGLSAWQAQLVDVLSQLQAGGHAAGAYGVYSGCRGNCARSCLAVKSEQRLSLHQALTPSGVSHLGDEHVGLRA